MGKSSPTQASQLLRSPRANNSPGGIPAPPLSKQATERPLRHTAASNPIQGLSPTHQRGLESAPPTSGQASAPPIRKPTASPHTDFSHGQGGGQTPEVREAILFVKRSPHQKPIKMKRQRTITLMRKKGKTPENQLSNEEILSLQEKDFRLLMLKNDAKTLEINWRQRWIIYRKH